MKNLSIKARVTLWYTVLMTIITIITMLFIMGLSQTFLTIGTKDVLSDVVNNSFTDIEYRNGVLRFDDDLVNFKENVYVSVYDTYGNLLFGSVPKVFNIDTPLSADVVQLVELPNQERLFHYENKKEIPGYGDIWVRGVIFHTQIESTVYGVLKVALIALPVFMAIVLLGGYLITRKSFKPVERIRHSAEQISQGNDLSRRLNFGDGKKDELYTLAETFDHMLERLQTSFERESQFTSDVSHELRTPITVIKTEAEYGLTECETVPELKEVLGTIHEQSDKMSGLINQLLTLARAEHGTLQLEKEEFSLGELIELVIESQTILAEEKQITIEADIPENLLIIADQTLVIRLFHNLIGNAISYGEENGHIWVNVSRTTDCIVCSIKDDGIGIAPEHMEHIWQRFYQVNPSRTEKRALGAGLGLSMVKWIVTAHGWSVTVNSSLGQGTEFLIKIPN